MSTDFKKYLKGFLAVVVALFIMKAMFTGPKQYSPAPPQDSSVERVGEQTGGLLGTLFDVSTKFGEGVKDGWNETMSPKTVAK